MPFDHSHKDGGGDDRHDPEKQLLLAASIIEATYAGLAMQNMCASCFVMNLCINFMSDLMVNNSFDDEKVLEVLTKEVRKATEVKRRLTNASN